MNVPLISSCMVPEGRVLLLLELRPVAGHLDCEAGGSEELNLRRLLGLYELPCKVPGLRGYLDQG